MRIAQLVHTLNYGDAISGEALAIRRILSEQGIDNRIFSLHAHEKVTSDRFPLAELADYVHSAREIGSETTRAEKVVVILHYSLASPLNEAYLALENAHRVIIYHNLTPPRWFAGYNARVHADLVAGEQELPQLLSASDEVIADSHFNARELEHYGCDSAQVLGLLIDLRKWSVEANPGIRDALLGHGGRNFLHVGRTAPNKCLEDIIKAFYFYYHKIDRQSRLWLIGSDIDTEIYSFELSRLVTELRLKEAVNFVGSVSDGELRSFYENSDVYLAMSEHEGFCVPLLEAMHFNLPIIAFDSSAVGETLGDAGYLIGEKDYPRIAELMSQIVSRSELVQAARERGQERLKFFSEAKFRSELGVLLQKWSGL
ncbi:MAG: glycosyltransferase [bacterium]|nr:glycosyltransferase [bacterium]